MKRFTAAAACAAVLAVLAGCSAAKTDVAAAAAPETKPASSSVDRAAMLETAAEGYANSYIAGNYQGMAGYLDPEACDDDDRAQLLITAGAMTDIGDGATMDVTSVYVEGDRGGVDTYELSAGAPDALRRLIKTSMSGERQYSWTWSADAGEWYLTRPCLDEAEKAASA